MAYTLKDRVRRQLYENLVLYPGRFMAPLDYLKPGRIGGYVGWIGQGNVGDEILYECITQLFPSIRWTTAQQRPIERKIHKAITRRTHFWDVVALGGGTLLNHSRYLRFFDFAAKQAKLGVIFGTGVEDPTFPSKKMTAQQTHQLLTDWCATMRQLPFVGVRGPHT